MWFKNLTVFKFEKDFILGDERLGEELEKKPFSPCKPSQMASYGWETPLGKESNLYTHTDGDNILFRLKIQEKILPPQVVKDFLLEKVEQIESDEDRKVSAREKKELKEDIEFELLPRAFSKNTFIDAWIDTKNQWLVIDTNSPTKADMFTQSLRKTLGSLPITFMEFENNIPIIMTRWLNNESNTTSLSKNFTHGYECKLKDNEIGTATYSQNHITEDEVQHNIRAGKHAVSVGLYWQDKISLVLTEDFVIKKLKFLDVMQESLSNSDPQTHAEHMEVQFTLMAGEVGLLINDLIEEINNPLVSIN